MKIYFAAAATCLLGACTTGNVGSDLADIEEGAPVPEEVLAVAAPYQDLSAVILRPEDGCFWYRYVGPVETTLLPLRTTAGRHICTRSQSVTS
ncbi:hypothetical protein [Oceanomicrobium pacificus]|uniref:Lipoprotein n=1 Tax=Oceanomicrobium pacificus TaxID=2692916 RepID=A0A6B0TY20_9RHOB|nr:hypothetical protein [Oceanomicrobium pacificus]MXU65954.1 hypothetical protein [Oceanomicrobium pacificus]